jgi:hypothetical protein
VTDFLPAPESAPAPVAQPAGLLRRLTDDELAAHVSLEQGRRDERLLLADPQLPTPDFGPLPQPEECTRPVFACGAHAINQAAAVLVHTKACTAPNAADLPGCDCTPEPPPKSVPAEEPAPPRLPKHWIT